MATVNLRIGPSDLGRKMTLEAFHEAEDQCGYLYELARGVLEVTEVPGDDDGQILHNLQNAISSYIPGLSTSGARFFPDFCRLCPTYGWT